MSRIRYRVKPEYKEAGLITVVNANEPVSLSGNPITRRRQKGGLPPFTETVRGATEEDLKTLYESAGNWDKFIEKYEETETNDGRKESAGNEPGRSASRKKRKTSNRRIPANEQPDTSAGDGQQGNTGDIQGPPLDTL